MYGYGALISDVIDDVTWLWRHCDYILANLIVIGVYTTHEKSTMIMQFVWLWNNFSFNVYYYLQHDLQMPWSSCIF